MSLALSVFNAGTTALHQGDLPTAVRLLQKAVRHARAPAIAVAAHRNLGIALRKIGDQQGAIDAFDRAIALDPNDIDALYNRANALVALGRHEDAIDAFQAVRARRPEWAQAANNEGAAWMALGCAGRAEECFADAIGLDPEFAHAWGNLGAARAAMGRHASPLHTLRQALSLAPNDPSIRTQVGHLLTELGHFDAAIRTFERVLSDAPDRGDAQAGLSLALHRSGDSIGALARIAPSIAQPKPHPDEAVAYARICLHMQSPERAIPVLEQSLAAERDPATRVLLGKQLGQVLDAAGMADRAYTAIAHANRERGLTFDERRHRNRIDRIISTEVHPFTQGSIMDATPVFIVGIPRSGTTLLEQMLDAHPDVHGAGERAELAMIAEALPAGPLTTDTLDRFARLYLERIKPLAPNAQRITDKMPDNVLHLGLAGRLFPAARVIHCVRDPADAGLSCLFQHFKDTLPWATDVRSVAAYIHDHRRLMQHWTEHCPLRMMTVPYESLVADPAEWAVRIQRFLGLTPCDAVAMPHINNRVVRTASHDQVRNPIHTRSVGRSRLYRAHLEPLLELRSQSAHAE
ncbi:MAG: sulfotransferase [Myxococcota bacterium]|nr:sulfotransferase [Myxococcota bacterium]